MARSSGCERSAHPPRSGQAEILSILGSLIGSRPAPSGMRKVGRGEAAIVADAVQHPGQRGNATTKPFSPHRRQF